MLTNIKGDFYCPFCNKHSTTKQGNQAHVNHCKLNPNRKEYNRSKLSGRQKGSPVTNTGKICINNTIKNKYIDPEMLETYIKMGWFKGSKYYITTSTGRGSTHELEELRKQRISKTMKEHNCGGYRKGSGRGHKGRYKNIYCDSSWELAFLYYHVYHNLRIERCKEFRTYIFNGVTHRYLPDFITDDGIIEIKGYKTEQSEAKRIQNSDIIFLYEHDLQKYIDFVVDKYGKEFWKILYDK